jgi:hypothetical protein
MIGPLILPPKPLLCRACVVSGREYANELVGPGVCTRCGLKSETVFEIRDKP